MLPFELGNLNRVNRILVRHDPTPVPKVGELIRGGPLHLRLYIDAEQVIFGAERQSSHGRQDGEFTVDLSGLKLTLIFLEQITGLKFIKQPKNQDTGIEEYHRSDLRPTSPFPFTLGPVDRIM